MATNYQRGRAFEYRTRNKLLERGAVYVMRAAQSKGAADLIALWPTSSLVGRVWIVQCKRGVGRISPAEREVLLDIAWKTGAYPVQALPGKNGRGVVFTDLQTGETL